jgi:hypothetical protein
MRAENEFVVLSPALGLSRYGVGGVVHPPVNMIASSNRVLIISIVIADVKTVTKGRFLLFAILL